MLFQINSLSRGGRRQKKAPSPSAHPTVGAFLICPPVLLTFANFIQRHLCSVHVSAATYRTNLSQDKFSYIVAASALPHNFPCSSHRREIGNDQSQQSSGTTENKGSVWTEHREQAARTPKSVLGEKTNFSIVAEVCN